MKKKLLWLLPPLALLAFFLIFFTGRSAPEHVFLITLDTTRADALDYGPPEKSSTPNLAALAAGGVRFENAYTVIPITAPSHAAMFYSLPPHVFKIFNNGQKRTAPYPTLAEIMKKKGYATGAVISLAVLNRDFGLARGFDHYLENFKPGLWYRTAAEVNRDAFALVDKLKNGKSFIWLHYSDPHEPYFPPGDKARFTVTMGNDVLYSGPSSEQPVLRLPLMLPKGETVIGLETEPPAALGANGAFAGIGYSDLQLRPLDADAGAILAMAPSPDLSRRSERYGLVAFNTQSTRSALVVTNRGNAPCRAELAFKYQVKTSPEARRSGYEREVRYLDSQIGLLLDHLKKRGLYERSTFLVMGDHGEGLGEYRSHFGHIHYLNKVYTHVPFFVSGKNIRGGRVSADLVSNFSVAPTLLSLIGARKPKHMAGSDALAGADDRLFQETYSPESYFDAFAVIRFPWQVIFYPGRPEQRLEFYNLQKDRFGTSDLHAGGDPSGQRSEMTNSLLRVSRIITANKRKHDSLNQKTMDTLKSLGYL